MVTRNQIEKETDYKKLQAFGRAYRKEGHELVLNAPEKELKVRLLEIFDECESKAKSEAAKEDSVELGAENAPEEQAKPQEAEVNAPTEEEEELGEELLKEAEKELVPAKEEKKEKKEKLYFSKSRYQDWTSKWSFDPHSDKPKPLPKKLTEGLRNAIKTGRILEYKE